ncbi:hypothetical protein BKI52_28110 [marine bacterium AO1-C]|nr:hypothetical protein BKI52_28110 [marine bacterium AO1-C]
MKIFEYIDYLQRIDALIRRKATGSPKSLARKMNTSERTVYRCMEELKALGLPISYDRNARSYVYTKNVKLEAYIKIIPNS